MTELAAPGRSDARRNRERLVIAAAEEFAERGLSAAPADIARRAKVGVGTLYRHFPQREALVDAAFQRELQRICAAAPGLVDKHRATEALRVWANLYLDHAATMDGMSDTLNAIVASGQDPYASSCAILREATNLILAAGAADGTLRTDIGADDILLMISGIAQAVSRHGTREQRARLVDLLVDGLTPAVSPRRSSAAH